MWLPFCIFAYAIFFCFRLDLWDQRISDVIEFFFILFFLHIFFFTNDTNKFPSIYWKMSVLTFLRRLFVSSSRSFFKICAALLVFLSYYFALSVVLSSSRLSQTSTSFFVHCSSCVLWNICVTFFVVVAAVAVAATAAIMMIWMCAQTLCKIHANNVLRHQNETHNRVCNTVAQFGWTDWKALVWRILTSFCVLLSHLWLPNMVVSILALWYHEMAQYRREFVSYSLENSNMWLTFDRYESFTWAHGFETNPYTHRCAQIKYSTTDKAYIKNSVQVNWPEKYFIWILREHAKEKEKEKDKKRERNRCRETQEKNELLS